MNTDTSLKKEYLDCLQRELGTMLRERARQDAARMVGEILSSEVNS